MERSVYKFPQKVAITEGVTTFSETFPVMERRVEKIDNKEALDQIAKGTNEFVQKAIDKLNRAK